MISNSVCTPLPDFQPSRTCISRNNKKQQKNKVLSMPVALYLAKCFTAIMLGGLA